MLVRGFQRLEAYTTRLSFGLAMLGLALMAAATFFQVVTRFVFNAPSAWSEVAARSIMIWTVYLGMAAAFRAGAMIAVDFVLQITPPRLRIYMHSIATLLCGLFLGLLLWQGILMTERVSNQALAGLPLSIAWIYAALPTGAFFALLALISRWIDIARDHRAGRYDLPLEDTPS